MPTLSHASLEVYVFRREAGRAQYLLLRAAAGTPGAGEWQHIAGQVPDGETAVACARRMVQDAIGQPAATLWALDHTHTYFDARDDAIVLAPVFLAEITESRLKLAPAFEDFRWAIYDQAVDLVHSSQRASLTRAHEDVGIALDRGARYRVTG